MKTDWRTSKSIAHSIFRFGHFSLQLTQFGTKLQMNSMAELFMIVFIEFFPLISPHKALICMLSVPATTLVKFQSLLTSILIFFLFLLLYIGTNTHSHTHARTAATPIFFSVSLPKGLKAQSSCCVLVSRCIV